MLSANRIDQPTGADRKSATRESLDRTMAQIDSIARKQPPAEPAFRAPPHNIEAEQALLGAILVNNEAFYRVSDFLEPKHFLRADPSAHLRAGAAA